ncbi:MAG: penicillin acylase family protein, partial [Pseudomonadota bacterium]
GRIGYFYNAAIPVRDPDIDWTKPAPGDASSAVWSGVRSFGEVPQVVDPDSGFVGNANNSPFEASAQADVPRDADFPQEYGIDRRTSNRGDRLLDLYLADDSITEEEFIAYKMDTRYHEGGRVQESVELLIELANEAGLAEEATLLSSWDLSSDQDNRAVALSILTVQAMLGTPYDDTDRTRNKALDTLREMSAKLKEGFGRIDPEWGEVNRLIRGNVSLPLDGGPDTLRAVYSLGDPAEGPLTASFGDTYVMSIGWDADGQQSIKTIHQFGSATLDETSPHYADQAKLFAKKNWKVPAMDRDALMSVATRTYKVPASE